MSKKNRNKKAAYRKTLVYLWEKVRDLRAKVESSERGARQLQVVTNALLAQAAVKYGVEENGEWQLDLPNEPVEKILQEYRVKPEIKGGRFIVTVRKR